jgi:hypothetical protein
MNERQKLLDELFLAVRERLHAQWGYENLREEEHGLDIDSPEFKAFQLKVTRRLVEDVFPAEDAVEKVMARLGVTKDEWLYNNPV